MALSVPNLILHYAYHDKSEHFGFACLLMDVTFHVGIIEQLSIYFYLGVEISYIMGIVILIYIQFNLLALMFIL